MKKILFVINNLQTGGIQKSLVELLNQISDKYEITLYVNRLHGPYVNQLPINVRIIEGSRFAQMVEYSRWNYKKVGGFLNYVIKALFGRYSAHFGRRLPSRVFCMMMGKFLGEYDVAISYSQPRDYTAFHGLENEFTLYCSYAEKKITFLHCDYSSSGNNTPYSHSLYKKFDAIAAVSNSVACKFGEILPDQKNKLYVINNCCNYSVINRLAEDDPVQYQKPCFISVSRIAKEKGLIRCVPIMRKLVEDGFEFEWHIVGSGESGVLNQLKDSIKQNGLENVVYLEGETNNPYRYMKNASYLFLPSFHEAAPMVFNEACCLGLRILTTNTLSAKEFVTDRGVGLVCDNDEESIYLMLIKALNDETSEMPQVNMQQWNSKVETQFDEMITKVLQS